MIITPRFAFSAHANALSGQIYVPSTSVADVECGSSALGITGGRARSQMKDASFGNAVSVRSARTFVEGRFDDEKKATEVVSHKARQEELTSTTRMNVELEGLRVGNNKGPFFTARRISASLVSRSPDYSGEPSIMPGKDTVIEGAAIDDYGLTIALDLGLFQRCDTRSKLVAAASDPKIAKASGRSLMLNSRAEGRHASAPPALVRGCPDVIYTTIVKEIKWTGRPFPGAKIEDHTVVVPKFGRIFFGELLISTYERRITMFRCDLGSPLRGFVSGGEGGSNGGWFP